jgi:hypothetical protein
MTYKTISNINKVGDDYFRLFYDKITSNKKLDYYLKQFNIEDYWIYKSTDKQRRVSIEEFYEFEYACYIFFKKDKYDYKEIDESLKLMKEIIMLKFLAKPPPIEIIKKIKIII